MLERRAQPGAPVNRVLVGLAHALAARLGAQALLCVVDSAPQVVELVPVGEVGRRFFAIDPKRAQGMVVGAP